MAWDISDLSVPFKVLRTLIQLTTATHSSIIFAFLVMNCDFQRLVIWDEVEIPKWLSIFWCPSRDFLSWHRI